MAVAIVGFFGNDAYAASYDIKDQASCQSLPSGSPSWDPSTSTCTVTNISLTISNDASLMVENGITLVNDGGTIQFYIDDRESTVASPGTITNLGTIKNSGKMNGDTDGVLNNVGTIINSGVIQTAHSNFNR